MRLKLAWFAALALCSCTEGRPSIAMVRDSVIARLDGGSTARVRLASLLKTDGQKAQMFGVDVYRLQFVADAEFTDAAYYTSGGTLMNQTVSIATSPISQRPKTCLESFLACVSQTPMRAAKGDRIKLSGSAEFQKSEAGWHLSSFALSLAEPDKLPNHSTLTSAQPRNDDRARHDAVDTGRNAQIAELQLGSPNSCKAPTASASRVRRIDEGGQDVFFGTAYVKNGDATGPSLSFGGWGDEYWDFVQFPADAIDAQANSAVLCVFVEAMPARDPALVVGVISQPWTAKDVNIGNQPISTERGQVRGELASGWNAIDLTPVLGDNSPPGRLKFGIALHGRNNDRANGSFASSRAPDSSRRPRLLVAVKAGTN
jgi:hypothetical protein